jgi:hypothetical protein
MKHSFLPKAGDYKKNIQFRIEKNGARDLLKCVFYRADPTTVAGVCDCIVFQFVFVTAVLNDMNKRHLLPSNEEVVNVMNMYTRHDGEIIVCCSNCNQSLLGMLFSRFYHVCLIL